MEPKQVGKTESTARDYKIKKRKARKIYKGQFNKFKITWKDKEKRKEAAGKRGRKRDDYY